MGAATLTVQLPTDLDAPQLARRLLTERFSKALDPDTLATVALLASELLTNAVHQGQGTITLSAAVDQHRLLVELIDESSGPEHLCNRTPATPRPLRRRPPGCRELLEKLPVCACPRRQHDENLPRVRLPEPHRSANASTSSIASHRVPRTINPVTSPPIGISRAHPGDPVPITSTKPAQVR